MDFVRIEVSFQPNEPQPPCAVPNSVAQLIMLQPALAPLKPSEQQQVLHVPKWPMQANGSRSLLDQPTVTHLRTTALWENQLQKTTPLVVRRWGKEPDEAFWSYSSTGLTVKDVPPSSTVFGGRGHLYIHFASGRSASDSASPIDERVAIHRKLLEGGCGGSAPTDTSMVLRERIGTVCILLKDLRAAVAALAEDDTAEQLMVEANVLNDRIAMLVGNGTADGAFQPGDEVEGVVRIALRLESRSDANDRKLLIERIMRAIGEEEGGDEVSDSGCYALIGENGALRVHQLLPLWNDHQRVEVLAGFARSLAWSHSRTARAALDARLPLLASGAQGKLDPAAEDVPAMIKLASAIWPIGEDGIRKAPFTHVNGANNSQPYVTMPGGTMVGMPALQIQLAGAVSSDEHENLLAALLDAVCDATVGMSGMQCSRIIDDYLSVQGTVETSVALLGQFTAICQYALPTLLTIVPAAGSRYKEDFRCSRSRGGKGTTVEDMFFLLFTSLGGGEDCEDSTAMSTFVEHCYRSGRRGQGTAVAIPAYDGSDRILKHIQETLQADRRFVAVVKHFMPQGIWLFTKHAHLNSWMRLLVGHYLPCQLVLCVGGANPTVQADRDGATSTTNNQVEPTTFAELLASMQRNLNNLGNLGWDRKELPTCPHHSKEYMTKRGPDAHQAGMLLPLWPFMERLRRCMEARPKAWKGTAMQRAVSNALEFVKGVRDLDCVCPVLLECTTMTSSMAGASMHLARLAEKQTRLQGNATNAEIQKLAELDSRFRENELSVQRRRVKLDARATGLTTAGKPALAALLPSDPILHRTATEFYGCANGLTPSGPIASLALHELRENGDTRCLRALYLVPVMQEHASFGVPMERMLELAPGGMVIADILNAIPNIQPMLDNTAQILATVVHPCFPLASPQNHLPAAAMPPVAMATTAEALYELASKELARIRAPFDGTNLRKAIDALPWPSEGEYNSQKAPALNRAASRFPVSLHLACVGAAQYLALAAYLRDRGLQERIVAMLAMRRVNVTAPLAVVLWVGK